MVKTIVDKALFDRAKKYIPGGVNSPVRSFKAVGGNPVFMKSGKGSKIYSESRKEFIDYCLSWGALILGHAYPDVTKALKEAVNNGSSFGTVTKKETELAKLITDAVGSIEQVRLTNSGTEAVMGAVRLARAYTSRDKIIKFQGSYHGHADYLLSGSDGVPKGISKDTIVLAYNDIEKVEQAAVVNKDTIAAIIVEPVAANCGLILPETGFLEGLKNVCDKHNIVLIFDEVITGFRLSYGGAQKLFNIIPDLTCLGKIIGGGMPIGAFGGRRKIMKLLAPEGKVYQAGTLSGNPVAVSAGITTLKVLNSRRPYRTLKRNTEQLCKGIISIARDCGIGVNINYIGSMFSCFFTNREVVDFRTAQKQNQKLFMKFFQGLLKRGIYFSPSGFESNFISTSHTKKDIINTLDAIDAVFRKLRRR